jgi:hypothetical protein
MAAPTSDIGRPDLWWGSYGQGLLSDWFETTADLIWPQSVITYGRMRNDPQLKAVLNAYVLPILRARWALDGTGCKPEVVQHCADDLGVTIVDGDAKPGPARRRGVVWGQHVRKALNYLPYGHMPFERRYRFDAAGAAHLDNLGERVPWTIANMKINSDGTMAEVTQNTQREPITANRLVWYVNNQLGSNWAGESVLRPAFGAWLLKHEAWRQHATGIRRWSSGIPQVEAPAGATTQMVQYAQQLASAMRGGDQAGIGLPQGYKASILGMTGSAPDALSWIKYLDVAMAKMAMTMLIELGQTETGSRALGESFLDLYLLSLQSIADEVADTATSGHGGMPGIITDMVDQNWGTPDNPEPAPRLVCLDLGESYEITAEAIQMLVMSGAITPDEELDRALRDRWGLPKRKGVWVPSSRGLPAGTSIKPNVEQQFLSADESLGVLDEPGSGKAGGGGNAPPGRPAAPGVGASPAASAKRTPPAYVVASQWEPERHQADYEEALARLLLQYKTVWSAQRTDLVNQVVNALESGNAGDLALAPPPSGVAASMVQNAMEDVALRAARAMVDEAAAQGVHINLEHVRVDAQRLQGVAAARSGVSASYLAQQASAKALQVYGPSPAGFLAAADEVDRFLGGLSDRTVRDNLGAAITAAQNAGRYAVLEAAPESAGTATYIAAEWLDENTCEACRREDGREFDSLQAAEAAYPTGGFKDCQGLMRCRGTVVAVWGDQPYHHQGGDAGPKG